MTKSRSRSGSKPPDPDRIDPACRKRRMRADACRYCMQRIQCEKCRRHICRFVSVQTFGRPADEPDDHIWCGPCARKAGASEYQVRNGIVALWRLKKATGEKEAQR